MKKRLLALLLALVLAFSMLPTAFATDAAEPAEGLSAGAAEAEPPAEGETEEEAAEPEQPEAEEPAEEPEEPEQAGEEPAAEPEEAAAKEAEVAAFVADTSGVEAYLMGVRLQNGYYKTIAATNSSLKMDENTYSEDVPTGWYRYLHYENGTLTVVGSVDAAYSGEGAVLRVVSGTLTINGKGALGLNGTDTTALYVDKNNADICIDFTPSTSGQQLTIKSSGAAAVSGDLTIDNAGRIWIEATPSISEDADKTVAYDTIVGSAYIKATFVSITNTAGGACVNGTLKAQAEQMYIAAQSRTKAALTGGSSDLATDYLNLRSYCGALVDGTLILNKLKSSSAKYCLSGCTTGDIPVVKGDLEAADGMLHLHNQNDYDETEDGKKLEAFKDCKCDGALLNGYLNVKNGALQVGREEDGSTAMITGTVELINCPKTQGYSVLAGDKGEGATLDGDLILTNSELTISASTKNGALSYSPGVRNCSVTMQNSYLRVTSPNNQWKSIHVLDDYQWYMGSYETKDAVYVDSVSGTFELKDSDGGKVLSIRSGDKRIMKTERSARFLGKPSLDGVVGQSMRVAVVVGLTGDTLDLQKVRGYGYLYSSYKDGEEVKHYGLPASTDLSKYLTINTPAGGVWTVTTSGRTYQGDTELPLYIIGTATTTCEDVPLEMTISGDILASGEDLTVTEKDTLCWNIRAAVADVDFDDIRTAEEFAKAIGGEEYAQVTGDTVTLRQNACAEKNITMTGDFTVDLNGYSISSANGKYDLTISSAKGKQTIRSNGVDGKYNYNYIEAAGGELTLDTIWVGSASALSGTLSVNRSTVISLEVSGGFAEASDSKLGFAVVDGTGDLTLRKTEITKDSATSLRVNGGKVSIKDGTQIPCIVLVTGGEVQIDGGTFSGYEGHWLQQTGGLVSVNNGNLTGTMLVTGGELNLLGGEYSSGEAGNLGLYQSGGRVTAEDVHLTSTAMKEGIADGETYYSHHCIRLDGGELTLKNTIVTGAVFVNGGAKLEMTGSSILTVNAVALYLDSSTATLTNSRLDGLNLAVNLGGKNASVTLDGGELRGDIWGVLVGGGSFTMLDGTINGGETGILVTDSKCKLTIKGGEVTAGKVALFVQKGNTVQLSGGTFTGGLNAIFAENGTMKNWLAKDCEMSGDGLPDLFDPASKSETGPGTVRIVEADYVGKAEKANEIMAQLPADSSEIEKDDLALIEAAEEAYNAASADKNVKKLLDKELVKRVKAARKAYTKNEKAAQKVQTLIDALPDASKLDYAKDRKTVDKAKKAYDKLTPAQLTFLSQGSDTEPSAAKKLEACVEQIAILDTCADVLKAVQSAIKKLPAWERIKATDASKVEAAQKAMADLEAAEERLNRKIPIGEANEEKYNSSIAAYEDYKGEAEGYCKEHLTYLRTVKDAGKEDGEKIRAARTAYNELGKEGYGANVAKNIQSFIPKADVTMLKTLEKQLTKNEKAALKITNLIKKLPTHGEPFDAKEEKAIEAAWKAYDNQKSEAVRSFVEGADTLTDLYYQLHPELRPEPVGGNTFRIRFVDSETKQPIQLKDIFAKDAKLGIGRSMQRKMEVETSVFKKASETDTEVVIEHVPEAVDKQGWLVYFDYKEVNYAHPASPTYPNYVSDGEVTTDASGDHVITLELEKYYLRVEGVEVTEANATNILKNKSATYDFSTRTLTLNNAKLYRYKGEVIESNVYDLTLFIPEGTTSYVETVEERGFDSRGLHIAGKGTLHIAVDPGCYVLRCPDGYDLSITDTTVLFDGGSGGFRCANLTIDGATVKNSSTSKYGEFFVANKISITSSTIDLTISEGYAILARSGGRGAGDIKINIKDSNITLYTTKEPDERGSWTYLLFAECGSLSIEGNSTVNLVAPYAETNEDHSMLSATESITIGKGLTMRSETGKQCEVYQPRAGGNYSVRCKDGTYPKQIFIASAKTPVPAIRMTQVTAYVGSGADRNKPVVIDGSIYYYLPIYVDGEPTEVYVSEADMDRYFNDTHTNFQTGFYIFRYVKAGDMLVAEVQAAPDGLNNGYLREPVRVDALNERTSIVLKGTTYPLAGNCVFCIIQKGEVGITNVYWIKQMIDLQEEDSTDYWVYVDFNDSNQVSAIYMLLPDTF